MRFVNYQGHELTAAKVFCVLCAAALGILIPIIEIKVLLFGIIAASILVLILINPFLGVSVLAFSIPFAGMMKIIPGVVTANKLLGGVVVCSLVFYMATNRRLMNFEISRVIPVFFIFVLISLPTVLWSSNQYEGLEYFSTKLFTFGLILMISLALRTERQLKVFCAFACGGAALLGMYVAVFGMGNLVGKYGERLAGGSNENVLAHALAVSLLLSGFLFIHANKKVRVLVLVLDVFILIALGLTGSRGTWMALLVALLVLPIVRSGAGLYRRFMAMAALIGTISFIGFGIANDYFGAWGNLVLSRINELTSSTGISSFSGGRMSHIWPMYLEEFVKRPFWGGGYEVKLALGRASHNDFLTILTEMGLVGFVLFLLLMILVFKEIQRCDDHDFKSLAISMLGFLLFAGLTHNTIYLKSYALAIGVLLCLPLINDRRNSKDLTRAQTMLPRGPGL